MDYLIHVVNRINVARVKTINFNLRCLLFRKIDGNLTKSKQFVKHTVFPVNNLFLNLEKLSQQTHWKFQVELEARMQLSIHSFIFAAGFLNWCLINEAGPRMLLLTLPFPPWQLQTEPAILILWEWWYYFLLDLSWVPLCTIKDLVGQGFALQSQSVIKC